MNFYYLILSANFNPVKSSKTRMFGFCCSKNVSKLSKILWLPPFHRPFSRILNVFAIYCAKILPKYLQNPSRTLPNPSKSFQNPSKIDFRRYQGHFGHYFRPLIEKTLILYTKKVVPRRPGVPRRGQNEGKIDSNF